MLLFFTSTKLPTCTPCGQLRARTQARERANARSPAPTSAPSSTQFACTCVPAPMLHVAQHAVRPDAHAVAQLHTALEHHVHVDEHIAAQHQLAALVESRRIDQRDAGAHEFGGARASQRAPPAAPAAARSLTPSTSASLGAIAADWHAVLDRHGDHVREVVLALRVVGLQARPASRAAARPAAPSRRCCLRGATLRARGVLVLDDAPSRCPRASRTTRP